MARSRSAAPSQRTPPATEGVLVIRNPYVDAEVTKASATFQLFRDEFAYAQSDNTQESFDKLLAKYPTSSTWVYTAVSRTGSAVAQIPIQIIKKRLEGKPGAAVTGYDFGLRDLIDQPNPYQSWADLVELVSLCLDLVGNAFIEKVMTPSERTTELYVLNPARVKILPLSRGYIDGYVYTVNGREIFLPANTVVHIKLPHPLNDYYGLAPLTAARLAIDLDKGAQEWNRNFMSKGGWPGGAIATDADLAPETIRRLKREIKDTVSTGKDRAGHIMLLTSGLKYLPIAVSPKEMDWLDARRYSRDEILAIFGVPFAVAGLFSTEQTTARSAGVEQQIKQFYRGKVCSVVKRILDAINRQVVPAFSENYKLVPDLRSVPALADDVETEERRSNAAARLVAAGFPINQVMARFYPDMAPVPWGDVMWTTQTQVAVAGPFNPILQEEDGEPREAEEPESESTPGAPASDDEGEPADAEDETEAADTPSRSIRAMALALKELQTSRIAGIIT